MCKHFFRENKFTSSTLASSLSTRAFSSSCLSLSSAPFGRFFLQKRQIHQPIRPKITTTITPMMERTILNEKEDILINFVKNLFWMLFVYHGFMWVFSATRLTSLLNSSSTLCSISFTFSINPWKWNKMKYCQ